MSGEVVNLRRVRKARARVGAEQAATENRAKFGRTKGEKAAEAGEAARIARLIDGAKRES